MIKEHDNVPFAVWEDKVDSEYDREEICLAGNFKFESKEQFN